MRKKETFKEADRAKKRTHTATGISSFMNHEERQEMRKLHSLIQLNQFREVNIKLQTCKSHTSLDRRH
ncbi:CLUMA_CG007632, isoform A [Clunio marinus]|uniref:CLUMA_CG007632, isoform A n=1 Tax=Clunio marinus TaxID=568069 RepID=A0A1J1I1F3_9DIPT|nr:CLUMA_CG007632, isoform A [Clunio marinus]